MREDRPNLALPKSLLQAFVQKLIEQGVDEDTARRLSQYLDEILKFILVDCPEVQVYDQMDRHQRQRVRDLADWQIRGRLRSTDVSNLGCAGHALHLAIRKLGEAIARDHD